MKNFHTLCFCFISCLSFSQIPNGGFESWEQEFNYEKPSFWETNQDTEFIRVTKDTLRVEGDFSMKLSSNSGTAWLDCNSRVILKQQLDQPIGTGKSFFFNVIIIPETPGASTFFSFYCNPYINGMLQPAIVWDTEEEYPEFTLIEVPILNPEIDSFDLQIVSGAINGAADGCHSYTEAWIDELSIDIGTTATSQPTPADVNIYPNPTTGKVIIEQTENEYHNYCIFNIMGQEIQKGDLHNPEINLTHKGVYFIRLTSNFSGNRNITKKIIVTN